MNNIIYIQVEPCSEHKIFTLNLFIFYRYSYIYSTIIIISFDPEPLAILSCNLTFFQVVYHIRLPKIRNLLVEVLYNDDFVPLDNFCSDI